MTSDTSFNLVVKNGRVIDPETRSDGPAHVGIRHDRIVAIMSPDETFEADHVIDASGLVVAPGFIDIHSHEVFSPHHLTMECFVLDGVTTQVGGNCGVQDHYIYPLGEYFNRLDQDGCLINFASYCGHFSIRERAGAKDPYLPATARQIDAMTVLVEQEMRAGALGISYGIMYSPGAVYEELLSMARMAAKYGGMTAAHARCGWNSPEAVDSVREMVRLSKESGIPHQYSHIGSMAGYGDVMDQCLETIDSAQAEGLRVYSDIYPYTAWQTGLGSAILDENFFDRFSCTCNDLEVGAQVTLEGNVLMKAGERFSRETFDHVRSLVLEGRINDPMVIGHIIRPDKVKLAMLNPYVMIGSDGFVNQDPATGELSGHPRTAGTYARFLGHYVREEGLMDLPSALFKCTTLPARVLGLKNKGRLAIGADADITIFDPDRIIDRSTFGINALKPPKGIEFVLVNGELTVSGGKIVPRIHAGKAIRRTWTIGA